MPRVGKKPAKPWTRKKGLDARSSIDRQKRAAKPAEEAKKARARKVKRPARRTLIRKLDNALSIFVRRRDRYCVICGSPENATNGHVFGRTNQTTRWSLSNNFQQCSSCNTRHNDDPYPYLAWYELNFGREALEALHRQYWASKKMSDRELAGLLKEIEAYELPAEPPQYKRLPFVAWVNESEGYIQQIQDIAEALGADHVHGVRFESTARGSFEEAA